MFINISMTEKIPWFEKNSRPLNCKSSLQPFHIYRLKVLLQKIYTMWDCGNLSSVGHFWNLSSIQDCGNLCSISDCGNFRFIRASGELGSIAFSGDIDSIGGSVDSIHKSGGISIICFVIKSDMVGWQTNFDDIVRGYYWGFLCVEWMDSRLKTTPSGLGEIATYTIKLFLCHCYHYH